MASTNPAFEPDPQADPLQEDATKESTPGKYQPLTDGHQNALYATPTDVKPTATSTPPTTVVGPTADIPEKFTQAQAFRYSSDKKALEALAEVADIVESIVADKPYAGMDKEELLRFSQTPFWNRFRMICTIVFWAAWAALLGTVIGLTVTFPQCVPPPETSWAETGVLYQIYVRSFYDSDGDGIGDLEGIRQKLPYLSELGVDGLILSSFYESQDGPAPDYGYEVTDHTAIDAVYGTKQDFDQLLQDAHDVWNIRIILDFIPNYTGLDHPWFVNSSADGSRDNPYWNYYVWADCPTGSGPVNNWRTVYGESMWTENGTRGGNAGTEQCYLHQFLPTQPELNLRSKAVQDSLEVILRYWLDQGVDGFRVDKIQHLFEDADFRDEELITGCADANSYDCYDHVYTTSQDEIYQLVYGWRSVVDEYTATTGVQRVLLTDSTDTVTNALRYYGLAGRGATFPLNPELTRANVSYNGREMYRLVDDFLYGVPQESAANWMTGAQDLPRLGSVFPGDDPQDWGYENALTILKMTLPGVAVMYYGEEIGMTNVNTTSADMPGNIFNQRYMYRTPMQWTADDIDGGFIDPTVNSTELPWLPIGDNGYNISVEAQNQTQFTPFEVYKQLVDIRRNEATLSVGSFQWAYLSDNVLSYYRGYDGRNRYVVAINFGPAEERVDLTGSLYSIPERGNIVVASRADIDSNGDMTRLLLQPGDGVVLSWAYTRPDGKPNA